MVMYQKEGLPYLEKRTKAHLSVLIDLWSIYELIKKILQFPTVQSVIIVDAYTPVSSTYMINMESGEMHMLC